MKKIFLRSCIVIFTLGFGLTAASFWLRYNSVIESFDEFDFTEITTVNYCDLIKDPQKYDGKIIRLKGAILRKSDYGYIFCGEFCPVEGINAITSVIFYEPKREEIFNRYSLVSLQEDFQHKTVEIIIDGRFKYYDQFGNSDAMWNRTHLQFEIYSIGLFSPLMDCSE